MSLVSLAALSSVSGFVKGNPSIDYYKVLGISPELVFDFDDEYYRTSNSKTTFESAISHNSTTAMNGTMVDSDGLIKWGPHNLALNSASPATQSITVISGADYTVECTGVSIVLSGAGTGTVTEGNPVEITASTTTLTLTVTGSTGTMWCYRSDLGGMVNNPDRGDSYVPTTSSAVYLPRRGHHVWNGSAWVNEGLLIESEQRVNLALYSRIASGGVLESGWVVQGATASATTSTAPDGSTDGATISITANSGNNIQRIISGLTIGQTYTASMWLKGVSGQQIYFVAEDVAAAQELITFTGDWQRVSKTYTATDTAQYLSCEIYNRSGGAHLPNVTFEVWGAQYELGSTPSSYIPTNGNTATRGAETLTVAAADLPWPTPRVIGPELVTNGTFDTDTSGWTAQAGDTISVDAGRLKVDDTNSAGAGLAFQTISTSIGSVYIVRYASELGTATQTRVYAGTTASNASMGLAISSTNNPDGTLIFVATSTTTYISLLSVTTGAYSFFDNISVREVDPLSVSIQMDGLETFADEGSATQETLFDWRVDANKRITLNLDTDSAKVGTLTLTMVNGSGTDKTISTTAELTPGINDPFNVAIVCTSNEIGIALDGTAETRVSHSIGLPDLSSSDATLGGNGSRALTRMWAKDLTNAGLEDSTT